MERVTFCPACGSETPQSNPRCEMCGAPLRKDPLGWARRFRAAPTPSVLALLIALAVIALIVAVTTALLYR